MKRSLSNKSAGNRFEAELCRALAAKGFWAHNFLPAKDGGQPADIIAVMHGYAYLIDCKVCSGDAFELRRMEENQRQAMDLWLSLKGTEPYFALKDSKGQIWMLGYSYACAVEESGKASVRCERRGHLVWPFEEWMEWVTP